MYQAMESLPSTSTSQASENVFIRSIYDHFQRVLQLEDKASLEAAKACIPLVDLQLKAIERMRDVQKEIKSGSSDQIEVSVVDALLVELLNWFKTSFFTWVDTPPCDFCSSTTKHAYNCMKFVCGENIRVEVYQCELCDTKTEFPRYNKAANLLITRKGRCGEWANCFTLLCRALDYDARFVVDTTDHVWTEVYSFDLKRWVHLDPCENAIDQPLMYETGWGKKLEYVIAYSKDDVQDVTWRYSGDHKSVLARRTKCTENDLIMALLSMREERWKSISKERKKFVKNRLCMELVELMLEKNASENEKEGRTSGSLAWRLQRKEVSHSPYIWEIENYETVCIRYQTSSDQYVLEIPGGNVIKTLKGWNNGIYDMQNIQRKEENDWKMTYLSRKENSNEAKISWKISNGSKSISKLNIKVSSQAYFSGKIQWILNYNDISVSIPKNIESNFILENIENLSEFVVTANLSGGDGNLAWQHSQILRQELNSAEYPLEISITSKNSH